MQFLTTAALFMACATAAVVRSPEAAARNARLVLSRATPAGLCAGIDAPLCCETDVDGVADLTCEQPSPVPSSTEEFVMTCSKSGLTAECCLADVDGDGLVCTSQA